MNILRFASTLTSFFEVLFFGGVIFGWPQLQYVLHKEGYYECPSTQNSTDTNSTQPCAEKTQELALVFQVAVFVFEVSAFPFGIIQDAFGTWVSRTIACSLNTCGYILLSVTTKECSWLLHPSMIMISIAGFHFLLSNIQLGNLMSSYRSIYVTFINGVFSNSVITLLLLKLGYDRGTSPQTFFRIMAALSVFPWVRTFVLMPKTLIPFPLTNKPYRFGFYEFKKSTENDAAQSPNEMVAFTDSTVDELVEEKGKVELPSVPTFKSCVFSLLFISNVFVYAACFVRFAVYLGGFVNWVSSFKTDEEVGKLTDFLGYIQLGIAALSPLNGAMATVVIKHYRSKTVSLRQATLRGLLAQAILTTLLQILVSISVLMQKVYWSMVIFMIFRAVLFGTAFNFIAGAFPPEHFGKLMGLTQAIVGTASLVQYAHLKLAAEFQQGLFVSNVYFLAVSILCLLQPLLVYREAYKPPQNRKK